MYPYILPEDICVFRPLYAGLKIGQVGLVVGESGIVYSHRLHRIDRVGSGIQYVFRGDTNGYFDKPVYRSQIVGVLSELRREEKTIRESAALRKCWSYIAARGRLALLPFAGAARRKEVRAGGAAPGRWELYGIGGSGGTFDS